MPAGDAQRAWFPEMLDELTSFWVDSPDWNAVIEFCERMTKFRSDIRSQRGIIGPMMTCRSCGKTHSMNIPEISPRSLLFALKKKEVIDNEEFKRLDKSWMSHRKAANLDANGHVVDGVSSAPEESTCR